MVSFSSAAKKKKYDSVSLKTFRRWSFSDDFPVETDAEGQISLLKCKICTKHLNYDFFKHFVHFLFCFQLKFSFFIFWGVYTLIGTQFTLVSLSFCWHLNDRWYFLNKSIHWSSIFQVLIVGLTTCLLKSIILKMGSHEYSQNQKNGYRWVPMISRHGTKKLFSMGFEIPKSHINLPSLAKKWWKVTSKIIEN